MYKCQGKGQPAQDWSYLEFEQYPCPGGQVFIPKKTYNVDSPPISNRFANNMAVLVFCVQSTQKPNKGLDIKFEKENAENTTPKNHGSASNLCCRYSHKVGRMTAMDKILQKKNRWLFIQQCQPHTYHHQIMHLSHVKIKENCIKTLANASPIDQSKTSFPRYFGCYEN